MILSGWKEIANHLHCSPRTAQRYEFCGLPIHRPLPGRRSHVVTDSDRIDRWVLGAQHGTSDLVQHSRALRAQLRASRQNMHMALASLHETMVAQKTLIEQRAARLHLPSR